MKAWMVAQNLHVLAVEVHVSVMAALEAVTAEVLCPLRLASVAVEAHKHPHHHRPPRVLRISKGALMVAQEAYERQQEGQEGQPMVVRSSGRDHSHRCHATASCLVGAVLAVAQHAVFPCFCVMWAVAAVLEVALLVQAQHPV